MRVKLTIEYEGTRYCGWQAQPNGPSVQAAVESAWERLTGRAVRIRGAGRTDAGVHARGQVATAPVDDGLPVPVDRLARALNTRLPDDIVVRLAEAVSDDFDPRRDCVRKRYRYRLATGTIRPGRELAFHWHLKGALDFDGLAAAAACFVGTHDFASFAKAGGDHAAAGRSTVRTVERVQWFVRPRRLDPADPAGETEAVPLRAGVPFTGAAADGGGHWLWLDIEGRSFLYNMVRALVGTMVDVAQGRARAADIPSILAARDRRAAGKGAPARGLCLEWIRYSEC